jgi:hypothetical protein
MSIRTRYNSIATNCPRIEIASTTENPLHSRQAKVCDSEARCRRRLHRPPLPFGATINAPPKDKA